VSAQLRTGSARCLEAPTFGARSEGRWAQEVDADVAQTRAAPRRGRRFQRESRAAAKRAPRVLHVLQPSTGGVPVYVGRLSGALRRRGWDVTIAAPREAARLHAIESSGADFLEIATARGLSVRDDIRAIGMLRRYCAEHPVDVIHGHSSKAGALTAALSLAAGIPSVYSPHAWSFQMRIPLPAKVLFALVEGGLNRLVHRRTIGVSNEEQRVARAWRVAPPEKLRVVHTGLDAAPPTAEARRAARARVGAEPEDAVVAWVGRTGAQKRPGDLAPLAQKLNGAATVIAMGEGLAESPEGEALKAAGGNVVEPSRGAPELLEAADVLVMTSAWEGFPLATLEAMAYGVPVVAYAVGGIPEQVVDGETGWLVKPGDIDGLADRIALTARSPELRSELGRQSADRMSSEFTVTAMASRIDAIYRDAAPTAPAADR